MRRLALIIVLGALTAFGPMSIDMYLPAFPALTRHFHAPEAQVQLTLTACLAGLALGQLLYGPVSDALGRRRPLYAGLAPYVAAARFFSLLMLVTGLAPMLAPLAGAQVLRFTSWQGVFVVLSGYGLVLLIGVALALPETLPMERRRRGGLRHTLRTFRGLSRDRTFLGYALGGGLVFAAMFAYISGSSFVTQEIYGVSPQVFGLIFGVNALGIVLASQVNSALLGRVAPGT